MRTIFIIALSILLVWTAKAQQNLVPNGNFEDTISCPTASNQISNSTGWGSWTNASPDYFHTCASSTYSVGIPTNIGPHGYQWPHSGNAYAGIIIPIALNGNAEYITRSISPLQVGATYEVSLSINGMNANRWRHDNLGVFFFANGPAFVATTNPVILNPQVDFSGNGTFDDTLNWMRLVKTYTADSAYDNIVIGGFKHPNNIQIDTIGTSSGWFYYYIDSVVVKWVGKSDIYATDSVLCAGDAIIVPYRVNDPNYFNTNNVFSLQLSNASGSFANPVTISTKNSKVSDTLVGVIPANTPTGTGYRIRMVASSNADTSEDNGYNIKIGNISAVGTTTNSPICAGNTLTVNVSTVSGATYAWAGPNSYSSTIANNSFVNAGTAQSGNYYITLQLYGCTFKDTVTALVKPTPAKPVAFVLGGLLCAGDTLKLNVTSGTSGISWSWTGPSSYSASTQNPTRINATTAMSGDYIATADLNGCIAKDTVTVAVQPAPNAVTLSSNNPACSGDTLYVNSTNSSSGVTYNWAGPNSFSASTQNSFIANSTTAATGWYVMTVGLNGCNYKDSIYATINQTPSLPNISYNSPLCVGETLNLSTNSTGNYSWKGAGNFTSNQQNPARSNMQFGDTGSYSLVVTVSGCNSDTAKTNVTINPLPFVAIAASPGATICSGQQVQFTAYPNNHGGTPGYAWYINGIAAGNTSTVFTTTTLNNGDIVRCDMTEITKCSSPITDPSNDITMTVNQWLAPKVSISANPGPSIHPFQDITFTALATDAGSNPTYQWKRNGVNEAGATGPTWGANAQALSNGDEICVLVRSSYSCPQPDTVLSNCIELEVRLGVNDVADNNDLLLYPNPNTGKFILKSNTINAISKIEITNNVGQLVYVKDINRNVNLLNEEIDMSSPASGIYMLRLYGDYNIYSRLFVVR